MEVVYPRCAGLDVHKKTLVACAITPAPTGGWQKEIQSFDTMTADLLKLSDWLLARECTQVAMESTGDYWKPVFNILEANFAVVLVNAQHVKAVPGRKTDVKDAQWLAELLQHGLLRPSFIPPPEQRELRELTRHRTNFIRERVNLVNRLQKVPEGANIKLTSVVTDIIGVSARAMLNAIARGQTDIAAMAELAKGRLRPKRDQLLKALQGSCKPYHRFILAELLCQIDGLDETVSRFDAEIRRHCIQFETTMAFLDTIPGVGRQVAELIVAEVGTDMSQFPSAAHLAAWAGLAPGNHESAGKRLSGKTRKGNQTLRSGLMQAAHVAARSHSYLGAQYSRIAARRGKKRATMAVAHSILVIAYHLIKRQEPYRELGAGYFDQVHPEATTRRLVQRLERLGHKVSLEPQNPTTAAC
jgi:transposase